jgi:hypothetical protein
MNAATLLSRPAASIKGAATVAHTNNSAAASVAAYVMAAILSLLVRIYRWSVVRLTDKV